MWPTETGLHRITVARSYYKVMSLFDAVVSISYCMMLNLMLQVISFVQYDHFLKAVLYYICNTCSVHVLPHEGCSFKMVDV